VSGAPIYRSNDEEVPGFTLRTCTHLMPSSSERTRRAVDGLFQLVNSEHAEGPEPPPEGEDSGSSDELVTA
jgi:hypothetical protein